METLFNSLSAETGRSLDLLLQCIDKTFPLPGKHLAALPREIRELSRLLTSARPLRAELYLNATESGGAYIRYFLPWNVFRLCNLFSSGSVQTFILSLFQDDEALSIIDLGSGPLTFAIALWISFPALRLKNISVFCIDHNKNILRAGEKLFCAFTASADNKLLWNIKTIKCDMRGNIKLPPARLVCAINVCNELYWRLPQADIEKAKQFARRQARFLSSLTAQNGAALIVEPGIPRCGQFISLLKTELETCRFAIEAPCPPDTRCAIRGGKRGAKWCHFTFDTNDAPPDLQKLSLQAGLKKEKAAFSFLFAQKTSGTQHSTSIKNDMLQLRIVSDLFTLPAGEYGRYACSKRGLILLRGTMGKLKPAESGTMLNIDKPVYAGSDGKSGALVVRLT